MLIVTLTLTLTPITNGNEAFFIDDIYSNHHRDAALSRY